VDPTVVFVRGTVPVKKPKSKSSPICLQREKAELVPGVANDTWRKVEGYVVVLALMVCAGPPIKLIDEGVRL